MKADFMRNDSVAQAYGFTVGDSFSAHFSRASIESVLLYIFATGAWVVESLFDTYKVEVNDLVDRIMPHRPKWYRDMVLQFMANKALIPESDQYDTAGMNEDAIDRARVVKHAVAVESEESSVLTIKVAGEQGGVRGKLDDATEVQLSAYIAQIKDAGVKIDLVNLDPDTFNCVLDLYYDPMLLPGDVEAACRATIKDYIENLPFNGEYTNVALVDRLQAVEGVRIPEMRDATTSPAGDTSVVDIDASYIPVAGYFAVGSVTINMVPK